MEELKTTLMQNSTFIRNDSERYYGIAKHSMYPVWTKGSPNPSETWCSTETNAVTYSLEDFKRKM